MTLARPLAVCTCVLALVGAACGGAREAGTGVAAPTERVHCALQGEDVSGQVRVREPSAELAVALREVAAEARATDHGLVVQVRSPLAFRGTSQQLAVRVARPITADGLAILPGAGFSARHGLANARLRVRVGGRSGLELAIPCDAVALSGRADGPAPAAPDAPGARWYDLIRETPVTSPASGETIAWLGSSRADAAVLAELPGPDPAGARVLGRFHAAGVLVEGWVDPSGFVPRDPPSGVASTAPVPSPSAPPAPRATISVPTGTRVFASPEAALPWATTTEPLVLVSTERVGDRLAASSVEAGRRCGGSPCAPARLRWVIAHRAPTADDAGSSIGAWFDRASVEPR